MRLVPLLASVFLAGFIVISVTAGCAQVAWHRDGTSPALANSDLESCRRQGRLHSLQLGMLGTPVPNVTVDPVRPSATVQMPSPVPTRDAVAEQEFTMSCMRKKGYELVRVR
jgi:hypothetical protein